VNNPSEDPNKSQRSLHYSLRTSLADLKIKASTLDNTRAVVIVSCLNYLFEASMKELIYYSPRPRAKPANINAQISMTR
jgi:hypothetical protein